jgi:perosamine synthetase
MIYHNYPKLGKSELCAIKRVIKRGWVSDGVETDAFELKIKYMIQKKYALAVNSGTAALHLALISMGIGPGDEVIIPAFTFEPILQAIMYVGAQPILADLDTDSFNIAAVTVKPKISPRTKAVIVPHMFGIPADIEPITKLGIGVIEDCAQSLGSKYNGTYTGFYGDISVFSFKATKMITTGQGGMVLTNSFKLYGRMLQSMHYDENFTYAPRFNYRMSDIPAAIGNSQFEKLPEFINRRRKIAERYRRALQKQNRIIFWPRTDNSDLNHYRFILKFETKRERDIARKIFLDKRIISIVPIMHRQLIHRLLKQDTRSFTKLEKLAETLLSVPIYPKLTDGQVLKIAAVLKNL